MYFYGYPGKKIAYEGPGCLKRKKRKNKPATNYGRFKTDIESSDY
jgi:hypothetical protein